MASPAANEEDTEHTEETENTEKGNGGHAWCMDISATA